MSNPSCKQDLPLQEKKVDHVGYPRDKTIVDLFTEQVARTPERIAVQFDNDTLTYRELDLRSSQLANYLRRHGIKEDSLVPICLNRSLEIIIGFMGILKAGGAYVPIDPEYPADRIAYQTADTGANLAITDAASAHLLAGLEGLNTILRLDADWPVIAAEQPDAPVTSLTPSNLAYVIYTSGSTGRPKGVMIEHLNVVRLFFTDAPLYDFDQNDVWTMFHSFCFDFSVWEMYGALFYGGKVIVVPKNVAKDTAAFGDLLVKEKVTILNQTPSAFYILQDYVTATAPSVSVRYVIFGGEALTPRKIKPWKQHYPACRLINMYGITETTVHVTYQEIDWQHLDSPLSIIGDPIPTLQAYILDENRNMASVDVTGELYIGGAGLARGYLNRPDLTADRFIPNPFDPTPGERLYKTGDLARRLEDGNIEYLGRIDHQVKIRGFRIELGEIENVILQYPGIRNTVVIARDAHGDKQLIAYFLSDNPIDNKGLIGWMGTKLPDYMVPRLLMRLEKIPLTSNGKIDTKALPDPDASELLTNEFVKARNKTEQVIADLWQQLLNVRRVGTRDNFFELGGNSLLAVRTSALLKERHDITLPVTRIYQYPTVEGITSWLEGKQNAAAKKPFSSIPSPAAGDKSNTDIAIVSMAGRFPGADTIDQLWTLLKEGRESVTFFKKEELDPALPSSLTNDPDYVRARGILKNAAAFDASFFGIQPATAAAMDPQQRVFLEIAWEALEKAGCLPGKYPGRIGVFAGTGHNTYYLNNVFNNSAANDSIGSFQAMLVNDRDFIATRTAYQLDLKGPALSIHTACSTSLLAIAQAVDSLRRGQCEVALAGAASITSPINSGHLYQEGAMLSPDGHSNSFDADARGTVFSDGAGVVLLKSLDQARRDGDQILAVIKGTGVNNDGGGKGSFTAPSAEGQAGAIAMAIADAGIPASSISYVEAHGTATPLGDPIEIEGLQMAFHPQERTGFCAIGTIKSNMGHLTATSGVAGLIKTVLALQHRQLPPSINYRQPNPNIDFANSPFYVNTRLSDWNSDGPRRAGISSFGVGGTNVHVIVEEYPNAGDNAPDTSRSVGRPAQLITYSARSAASLEGYAAGLNRWLAETPESSLADIAATLQTTREDFPFRRYIVASTTSELASALASPPQSFTTSNLTKKEAAEVVFMFPGQGSQQTGMAKELYDHEPVFRQAVDECAEILNGMIGEDIRSILYPAAPDGSNEPRINETRFAQPALFVIEYALARLWISWGITPSAFIGHSVGEFVAAHLAGVFSLHDGLHLVSTRGKLMGDLPTGDMLGIRAPVDSILPILPADCSLAAINSPALCVVSGPNEAIGRFAADLQEKGIQNRLLHTSHAFHSAMMDPVLEPFGREVQSIQLNIPRIPIVSTVTGNWITEAEATSNDYWTLHLRSTVRFSPALVTLLEAPNRVLLEVGPRNVTTTLALQHSHVRPVIAIPSLGDPTSDKAAYPMLKALGLLYIHGIHPDWKAFYAGQNRRRPSLPTYSWDHKDYWLTPVNKPFTNNTTGAASVPEPSPAPQTQPTTPSTLQTFAMRKNALIEKLKTILENSSGIEMDGLQPDMSFIEVGLDSLLLTQIALSLKKEFSLPITFRQLSDQQGTLDSLASWIDANLPPDPAPAAQPAVQTPSLYQNQPTMNGFEPAGHAGPVNGTAVYNTIPPANANAAIGLIAQQIHLLAQQVALLGGGQPMPAPQPPAAQVSQPLARPQPVAQPAAPANGRAANEAGLSQEEIVELKKPFGATARIEKHATALSPEQHSWLNRLIRDYTAKTKASKDYTQQHRARMADPRVVSGFKPYTKEMVYSIVIERSKGSRLWDIDGNEYIDMLNGFGSNMLGYQPDFVAEAVKQQVDKGYEIGPQHVLAGEVTDLICEFTGFDRVGLCNTGSEAVLGAMRIARTVTGRSLIVAFTGSYHGIVDEVIVRGTKKLKSFPAASGIMPEAVQNMLILDYGTPESLAIIRERAHELAAVLIEPVQSRRPEFFPLEFLREVRKITEVSGTTLIFDEVITGFRTHPGGMQAKYGIRADIGTYGKVIGAGISIGVIAGKRHLMDALDGGYWQYGDASVPEVGVTYFAGTFVRHPLALASAKASLLYMKEQGPSLQENLNAAAAYLTNALEAICRRYHTPMYIASFCSLWKVKYKEEYPYSELLFTLLRQKGIHILDGFPCFLTTAHTRKDLDEMIAKFEEAVRELKEIGLIPEYREPGNNKTDQHKPGIAEPASVSANQPPVPNARLGKDRDGNPAWFIPDEKNPGKYLMLQQTI